MKIMSELLFKLGYVFTRWSFKIHHMIVDINKQIGL